MNDLLISFAATMGLPGMDAQDWLRIQRRLIVGTSQRIHLLLGITVTSGRFYRIRKTSDAAGTMTVESSSATLLMLDLLRL
jgi:hypothetical protein